MALEFSASYPGSKSSVICYRSMLYLPGNTLYVVKLWFIYKQTKKKIEDTNVLNVANIQKTDKDNAMYILNTF